MFEGSYQSSNEFVGEAANSDARSSYVVSELPRRAKALEGNQYTVAEWLTECKDNRYYLKVCETFELFVEHHVGISIRMAQLLMQVYRKSKELGLSQAEVLQTGISKLSTLNKVLTKDNVRELLPLAKTKSLRELKKVANSLATASGEKPKGQGKRKSTLKLTAPIRLALVLAGEATQQDDVQTNLEYIATMFQSHISRNPVCHPSNN